MEKNLNHNGIPHYSSAMNQDLAFTKMHGSGNDFIIIDTRAGALVPEDTAIRRICQRRIGIGCDQVIILSLAKDDLADVHMDIRNADGSYAEACGNATRCVAALLIAEKQCDHVVISTPSGLCDAESRPDGRYAVDMGLARFDWRDIPLAEPTDCLHVPIEKGVLKDGCAVNIGNPHIVFFVDDVKAVPLETLGRDIERHALFPQKINVEIVHVNKDGSLQVRVFERGVGITPSCGTGACAALLAAVRRRKISERQATLCLDGGDIDVEWQADDHVIMTGTCAHVFHGTIGSDILSSGSKENQS